MARRIRSPEKISGRVPRCAGGAFESSIAAQWLPRGEFAGLSARTFMMRTLFLHPPSYDGFDGGAGARYQMKREVRSFWYPTWLAQPAALVEGSKLIDAPPHRLRFADIAPEATERDLIVLHTSTPSFSSDIKTVRAFKDLNPKL